MLIMTVIRMIMVKMTTIEAQKGSEPSGNFKKQYGAHQ